MGKSVKGTRTEKNLAISFAGESQARMRYSYYFVGCQHQGSSSVGKIRFL